MVENIEIGYQPFLSGSHEKFGAIRGVSPSGLIVNVENAGDFLVPMDAVEAVQSQKVIFKYDKLESRLREAIAHAHDAEEPGL